MAGGRFDRLVPKIRPGTYINFENNGEEAINQGKSGTALIPLFNFTYGPNATYILLENTNREAAFTTLGYHLDDAAMLLVREAFKKAKKVLVYVINKGTAAAVTVSSISLTATAKYGGTRGNAIALDCVANAVSGFDVNIYVGDTVVETFEGLATIGDLKAAGSKWIDFTGTSATALAAFTSQHLTGGTDGAMSSSDVTTFLDSSESQDWYSMAFPVASTESTLLAALKSKIKYLREEVGKYRKAVVAGYAADYEGIINVGNGYKLEDGTELTAQQATAWVAGADSGANYITSNTYVEVDGAVDANPVLSHAEAEAAITAGKFVFSISQTHKVIAEYDINSLLSYYGKHKTWRKNRVLRVMDSFGEDLMVNFPPNRYSNYEVDWEVMEGIGRGLLKIYENVGAVRNVNYDEDFVIDRESSVGDELYCTVGLQPVDSAEKLYFTVKVR